MSPYLLGLTIYFPGDKDPCSSVVLQSFIKQFKDEMYLNRGRYFSSRVRRSNSIKTSSYCSFSVLETRKYFIEGWTKDPPCCRDVWFWYQNDWKVPSFFIKITIPFPVKKIVKSKSQITDPQDTSGGRVKEIRSWVYGLLSQEKVKVFVKSFRFWSTRDPYTYTWIFTNTSSFKSFEVYMCV